MPLDYGQCLGAQLRAGGQRLRCVHRKGERRKVGKKSRLKAGNLVGDGEEQTLDEFLQKEDIPFRWT